MGLKKIQPNLEHGLAVMNANSFVNGFCIFTQSGYYAREFAARPMVAW